VSVRCPPPASRRPALWRTLAVSLGLTAALVPLRAAPFPTASEAGSGSETGWRLLAAAGRGLQAVALHPPTGRLAVGDDRGVRLRGPEGWRDHATGGPVRDLAFDTDDPSGALWIASDAGLLRLSPDGRLERRPPAPGERGSQPTRVEAAGGILAVATSSGAFVSADGRAWTPVRGEVPSGPADAIALRSQHLGSGSFELWLSAGGRLYGVRGRRAEQGLELDAPGRVAREGRGASEPAADLAFSPDGVLWALGDGWVARVEPGTAGPVPTEPLALPPGAEARRLRVTATGAWLATDRGLLAAESPAGPWRPAAPALGDEVHDLLAAGETLYATGENGLALVGGDGSSHPGAGLAAGRVPHVPTASARAGPAGNGFPLPSLWAGEPSIATVQRAALAYQDLGPGRMRQLREGVDRRGWLPSLRLTASGDLARDRSKDFDQQFTGGATRDLFDEEIDRRSDAGVFLELRWDLGDVAFHPEAIDVSRESRLVIQLRDDVLDEVNRLYFERRRVLTELVALDPARREEAARLRIRADELAAGLDAWTGGWFGRQVAPLAP